LPSFQGGATLQKKKSKVHVRGEAVSKRWQRDDEKETYWKGQLGAWIASKLSVRQYCLTNGISESSFRAWRRELDLREREASSLTVSPGVPATVNPFVPIRLVTKNEHKIIREAQSGKAPGLELVVRGGAVIRVDGDTDLKLVSQLLSALEEKHA
jgi:hypothetical protein